MARQEVNIGVEGNDGTGDSIRESFRKVNENFQELYAVFGVGGTIDFLDLSDTPDSYSGKSGNLLAVAPSELGLETLEIVSDGELTGDPADDTIQFDRSVPGKLVVFTTFSQLSQDIAPELGGHMDANQFAIGKVAVSESAAQSLSAKFQESFTIEDLVINKRFAGQNYLKRGAPGISANLREEPTDASSYIFTIDSYSGSNVTIADHGLDSGSDGAAYRYSSTGSAATGLSNDTVYYVRIIDPNNVRLYTSSANAKNDTNPITAVGGSGTQTLTDSAYDNNLIGFWLENEALPRKSVVRRQGDSLEGALLLHDHPGELEGAGTPNGDDDLQAATKYYVDQSGYSSTINLYVNTQGDDLQLLSPVGKEGRTLNTAFASISKACEKAEEIQEASPYEAGPYLQTVTHSSGSEASVTSSVGIKTVVPGRQPIKTLLEANKEFIQSEVIAFVNQQYPDLEYDQDTCFRDVGLIIDSVILDSLSGNNANYLSRWAGIRYYSNPSARKAITAQLTETIAGIERAKAIADIVLVNDAGAAPYTPIQTEITQTFLPGQVPDGAARSSVSEKFDVVVNTIQSGPLDAPNIVDGSVYQLNITNGNSGFVDQGDPTNTDLLPGKLVIGRTSGAKGIIVNYIYENDPTTTTPVGNDTLELQLVEPIEFVPGEEIEFGNSVRSNQITILVEAGVYLDDYPIKLPDNVSIKGDEFRRTILRPKNRSSQSRYADTYFYRDREFDGLAGDSSSITGFPDTNLPVNGTEYENPLTSQVDGYFGYHYLVDATRPLNISNFATTSINRVKYTDAPALIALNREFIIEEVIEFINETYPGLVYNENKCRRDTGLIVDAVVADLENGGRTKSLEAQTAYYLGAVAGQETETEAAILYIKTIAASILANTAFPSKRGSVDQIIDSALSAEADSNAGLNALVDLVAFAFNANYNPARNNLDLDVFLMNDATRISNMTIQGHGGFMCVLDPDGQILTKSPYIQVGSSFSQSLNRQAFRGGMFVDAFTGNIPTAVISKQNDFEIVVQSKVDEGLFYKKPQTPAPFYIDGERFQINAVREWDPDTGTARLFLDRTSNRGNGFAGTTSTLLNVDLDISSVGFNAANVAGDQIITSGSHGFSSGDQILYSNEGNANVDGLTNNGRYFVDVVDATTLEIYNDKSLTSQVSITASTGNHLLSRILDIVVQTAGNRSMLGNDFTQINDLGYGLVVTNGGLSEMVSMFTYYTQASFYAKNGGEIRSLNGSNAYGNFGLIAEGADPNEIPDAVTLRDNLVMPMKTFQSEVTLVFGNATSVSLSKGAVVTTSDSSGTGTVVFAVEGAAYSAVYLKDVIGSFDTSTDVITTGSGTISGSATPTEVITSGAVNAIEQLSVYVYDGDHPLQNRGEFEIYHSTATPPVFGRYEVANFQKQPELIVGGHFLDIDTVGTYSGSGTPSGALIRVGATKRNGYRIYSIVPGTGYALGETITITGDYLGGSTPTNDLELEIDAVNDDGGIESVSVSSGSGTPATNDSTPYFDGQVYRLNFSTGSGEFSNDGLITALEENIVGTYRHNGVVVFENVANVDGLVTRPSTAVQFEESSQTTYRTISFADTDNEGRSLPSNSVNSGFDINFDYVRLTVDLDNVANTTPAYINGGTTLGNTPGDKAIAIIPLGEQLDRTRLANGDMIFAWEGKIFTITNYLQTSVTDDEDFDVIQFSDLANSDINFPLTSAGLGSSVVRGSNTITLRAGLQAGEPATITINISTCRATGHDFLDIGTGGFNTSNYPNVLFGEPAQELAPFYVDDDIATSGQVWERTKGRVFWVSTDQDGFFRVGRFFTVDQGTGTVTFAASIALSNLDGIGFKRGVVVAEFSTDTGMTNNAADVVPVQSAVRSYVNRRLGFDHNGAVVSQQIGPGVLPLDGSRAMTGDLQMSNNNVQNLAAPTSNTDAATKGYVDDRVGEFRRLDDLDNTLTDTSGDLINVEGGQLLVTTGFKRLIVASDDITNPPFNLNDEFVEQANGGKGLIKQLISSNDSILGNIVTIVYEDTSDPGDTIQLGEDIAVSGGAQATVILGPTDEIANGIIDTDTDIDITVTRSETDAELSLNYKLGSIVNDDINAGAAISQNKLAMNAATTRANATGISQAELGLASFDEDDFTVDNGWVTLKQNDVDFADLPQIDTNKALGNVSGSTGNISAIDITTTGAADSLVRTQNDGSIRIESLRLGGNNSYEVMSLSGTTLNLKTPDQATILSATGSDSTMIVDIPASVSIGNASASESVIQDNSGLNGESRLAVDWLYTNVIEDVGEKDSSSNGVAIGQNAPGAGAGIVSVFVADSTTTVYPAKFSASGIIPGTNAGFDIGSGTTRYDSIYGVTGNFTNITFNGSALTASAGELNTLDGITASTAELNTLDGITASTAELNFVGGVTSNVQNQLDDKANLDGATFSGTVAFNNNVTLGNSSNDNIVFTGEVNSNVVPNADDSFELGSSSRKWSTVYASTFDGTATQAQYADLAEMYAGDEDYAPGTVVVFGGDADVTLTDRKGDRRVAGVVSTNPAHLMNSNLDAEHALAIALQGRVPCQVLGKVEKGDLVVTSAIPGYAVVDNEARAGAIIGKALERKEDSGKGVIEVVVGRV